MDGIIKKEVKLTKNNKIIVKYKSDNIKIKLYQFLINDEIKKESYNIYAFIEFIKNNYKISKKNVDILKSI